MVCIGTGPGPKNVLVEFDDGFKTVVPYAVWKHNLSKRSKTKLAEKKQFVSTSGIVQKFGDAPAISPREVSNMTVHDFTIRSTNTQKLVRVTLFPEFGSETVAKITEGAMVSVDGPFQVSEKNGTTYFNLTARSLAITQAEPKAAREVVNAVDGGTEDGAPF